MIKKKSKRNTAITIKGINVSKYDYQKVWCAFCGKWGDHTSGGCKSLKKQLRINDRS